MIDDLLVCFFEDYAAILLVSDRPCCFSGTLDFLVKASVLLSLVWSKFLVSPGNSYYKTIVGEETSFELFDVHSLLSKNSFCSTGVLAKSLLILRPDY